MINNKEIINYIIKIKSSRMFRLYSYATIASAAVHQKILWFSHVYLKLSVVAVALRLLFALLVFRLSSLPVSETSVSAFFAVESPSV